MVNEKGMSQMPVCGDKAVGPQGTGGAVAGKPIMGVSNQGATQPKNIGGGRQPLEQAPVQPKVGK